jgi:hypothetical protein
MRDSRQLHCAAHRQHRQQIQVFAEIALYDTAELPPLLTVLTILGE